jgi:hypothetical protein
MHAEVPPVDCQAVLRAIPSELVPSLEGFELAGTFDLEIDADVDYSNLEALRLEGDVGIWNCEPVRVPTHAAVERLAGGFNHRVVMRDGRERSVPMYAASNAFTPLNQISPYMVSAVLTTEDGGFWRHRGFLPSQIQVALRRNLAAGRIELGASTITMQMVKNVLLSHERTLARKLQELFLTWYVERVLTKSRIMEVYLNAIEFGPGIYGVTRAARHYFGKWASDLTPPEAAYLALMLPSPVRRHSHFCKGELSPAFRVKLQRILRIMYERGRLTDLEHEVWKETELLFDPGERGDPSSCLSQGQAILSGTETQRALSGLLGDRAAPIPEADRVDDGPAVVDASEVDAPGRPAMDDLDGETGGAW